MWACASLCNESHGGPGSPVIVGSRTYDDLSVDARAQKAGDIPTGQSGMLDLPGVSQFVDHRAAPEWDMPRSP